MSEANDSTTEQQQPANAQSEDEQDAGREYVAANASFDDRLFLDRIEKDPFQKELDEAIEQHNLAEFIASHDNFTGLYALDEPVLEYEIESNGVAYKHKVNNPTPDDEDRKERMSVTIKKSAGKVDGDDAIKAFTDNANALRRYYDGVAVEAWGYPVNEDDNAEQWISVATVIEKADAVTDEDRAQYGVKRNADLTVLNLLPEADKLKVASMIHAGQCIVIREKNRRIRSLRAKREYVIKQLFGVKRGDDGEWSKPTKVVSYHFAEAGAKAIGKFDAYAVPPTTVIRQAGNEEHRILSIPTLDALFDAHITYIQGASIDGSEVKGIVQGDARLAKVPSACKRDATVNFFNALKS